MVYVQPLFSVRTERTVDAVLFARGRTFLNQLIAASSRRHSELASLTGLLYVDGVVSEYFTQP
jgi:hypothetical protein